MACEHGHFHVGMDREPGVRENVSAQGWFCGSQLPATDLSRIAIATLAIRNSRLSQDDIRQHCMLHWSRAESASDEADSHAILPAYDVFACAK